MFRLVKGLKTYSKEVEGGSDGKLCFSEKDRGKVMKDYIERIMDEESDLDHNVVENAVEGPVVCVSREEVLQELKEMKTGKAPGPSEVSEELYAASEGVGIQVMAEICQRVLNTLACNFVLSSFSFCIMSTANAKLQIFSLCLIFFKMSKKMFFIMRNM